MGDAMCVFARSNQPSRTTLSRRLSVAVAGRRPQCVSPAQRISASGQGSAIHCWFKVPAVKGVPAGNVDAKAELEKYRLGVKVLGADIERSSKASARMILQSLRGQTPQMDGVQKQRTAQTQQDCIAMIGFLFFAMNTFPLTPLLLPTALKYIPERWLVPSSLSKRRIDAMRILERQQKALSSPPRDAMPLQ
uniref:Uncharacterized protein n=1 Tax=Tetraselmis chuii TaxID=63592 RepID=A0A6U1HUI9_9CHLO|mmetsp:Transcript_29641/g.53092  ORF Transcript_29641/g.53092 Transcript_29641/m.53092 type:complete len:192 (+) Transcript_29641:169-744(+)